MSHLNTIATRTLIGCTKNLIQENQIAEQYLIAQNQLLSTIESIQKASKKLEQVDTHVGLFSKLCVLANNVSSTMNIIFESVKQESGSQLFQGVKDLALRTGELTKYGESISSPVFIDPSKSRRMTTVQNQHQSQFLEHIKNIRNSGAQLLGEAKSVINSQFESQCSLKLAATTTSLGKNIITMLKHIEEFVSPMIQGNTFLKKKFYFILSLN